MPAFYAKERSKYGNLSGQVIIWPLEYQGDPSTALNKSRLPAGYLKCDGTKYFASDYPALAAILGTGDSCKYLRRNPDGTAFDVLSDTQFMVPDLGSKYPEPTSGANAGSYNNIRLPNALGNLVSRSGIGIEVTSAIGDTVTITYSGTITVPSQEIPLRGRPSWEYAGDIHYTEIEGVEENAVAGHMHFHSAVRARNLQTNEPSGDEPNPNGGTTGRRNASTIPIQDWLDATRYNNDSGQPPGSGQNVCKAIDKWRDAAITDQGVQETLYYGYCIFGYGQTEYTYGCLNNEEFTLDGWKAEGSPNGNDTATYANFTELLGLCVYRGGGDEADDFDNDIPITYESGYPGVPLDFDNVSLHDVVPLQSNQEHKSQFAITDVDNETLDTIDLAITAGEDPTRHNHRIYLEKGDHSYKVKTNAINVPPENLVTRMDIGTDSSVSIDAATSPYIVMEYLIKI
ncbi:MAG: hypothetical protein CMO44_05900 [Verrucomicrobiales bacterium]|nr:hypothetical protein [Verrucomicrobiales bacterium]|tara:strand:+ start:6809 stop:8179 length:1371 start_codon:yes stop_codon:yes gene_type:complete